MTKINRPSIIETFNNCDYYLPSEKASLPSSFFALCSLDGRYQDVGEKLSPYFSEYALAKSRTKVEVYWLIYLIEQTKVASHLKVTKTDLQKILEIYTNFSYESFKRIKAIESVTNHDVKAVELFVDESLDKLGLNRLESLVHIGCTSEDINNTSYANMIKCALCEVWLKEAQNLVCKIESFAKEYSDIPMLAHTHGQPATPTTVGKEFAIFSKRMQNSIDFLQNIEIFAKFNGATGNYSAISIAYPNEDWMAHSKCFVEDYLKLNFNPLTTQIESHDYICHIADSVRHFNNILEDLDVDMWLYISKDYFKQQAIKNEVGSSTMPHKVNPIKFENSEANVELSNALLVELSNKLPRSRMQRDLSDSSTMRNIGLALGFSLQSITQTIGGLKRLVINTEKLSSDLDSRWEVLAEPIQTMLRKYGIADAYDKLKQLTRGKQMSKQIIHKFINSLDVLSDEDKQTLLNLTPSTYIGKAIELAKQGIE